MYRIVKLTVVFLTLAPGLTRPLLATSFDDFGRLNTDDEAGFIAFLVEASAHWLKTNGKPDEANRVVALFNDRSQSGGVHQLALNLQMLYATNKRNATKANNNTPPYQIEDAMTLTLRAADIVVPASYLMGASDDFRPSGQPRQHIYGP